MKKLLFLVLSIFLFSCSSNDDSNNNDDNDNPENYTYFIKAKVDGETFISGYSPTSTIYSPSTSYQPIYVDASCKDINYDSGLYPFEDESLPNMSVGFIGSLQHNNLTSCSQETDNFDTLFEIGSHNYADDNFLNDFGVSISYFSGNLTQKFYNSFGDQTNAVFTISEIDTSIDCGLYQGLKKCLKIKGTFSCKLYNQTDSNDFIDITNGEFEILQVSFNNI